MARGSRLIVLSAALFAGLPALAGMAQAQGQPPAATQAAARSFAIPAQPLGSALRQFADQSGYQLAYATEDVQDAATRGVSGSHAPEAALQILLAGTGIGYRLTAANTVTLARQAAQGAPDVTTLGPVTVQGQAQQDAWGPVQGYVAQRSLTATKTDTPLIETPQSISVVTRDEMDARAARTIGDALSYTAGVTTGRTGESSYFGGDGIAIRGFGGNGTAGGSFNEYVDGMRLRGTGYVTAGLDPFFYERVEVIKGPASVLYGQSTPGGIVNMVSKRPTLTPFNQAELQVGNFNRLQGSFDLSGPADQGGKFLFRLSGLALRTDTQTDFSHRQRILLAPSGTWRPTNDTSLTLLTNYQHDDFAGSPLNFLPTIGTVVRNPYGKLATSFFAGDPNYNKWDRTTYSAGWLFEHRFNETWTVRQNTRYLRNNLDYNGVYQNNLQANLQTVTRTAFSMVEHSNDLTLDNQAQANFATGRFQHTALFGIDGQSLANDTYRGINTAQPLNIWRPVYYQQIPMPVLYQSTRQTGGQVGLYAQDQIRYGNTSLLLGIRQDWAGNVTKNRLNGTKSKTSDNAFTKRAGLIHVFDSGLAPYVSYTESFEPQTGTDFAGKAFNPAEGQQYEAGLKYQPNGIDAFVTLSAFNLTRTNVLTPDPAHPNFNVQTGEVRSRGIEIEAKATLAEGLNLTAAYTFLDAEVTKGNDVVTGLYGVRRPIVGTTPVAVPRNMASAWGDYTFLRGSLKGFGLGLGVRYVGETYGDAANVTKVPGFTLFDAAIHYDLAGVSDAMAGWRASVNATNLFDKDYVSACTGVDRCYYGLSRTVMATVRYRW
jgi:iron complex outermembrane receptor protein